MKRASFSLVALSLVVIFGCQPKRHVANAVNATDCMSAAPGTRTVEITVRSDAGATPKRYEIVSINPESIYLSVKAANKIRWTIVNESGLPVSVTIDDFRNELNGSERDPFGSTSENNRFFANNVLAGNSANTAPSLPLNGRFLVSFKYRVTVDFNNAGTITRVILDPRVVVGD